MKSSLVLLLWVLYGIAGKAQLRPGAMQPGQISCKKTQPVSNGYHRSQLLRAHPPNKDTQPVFALQILLNHKTTVLDLLMNAREAKQIGVTLCYRHLEFDDVGGLVAIDVGITDGAQNYGVAANGSLTDTGDFGIFVFFYGGRRYSFAGNKSHWRSSL